jgi:hypothetical protein
MTMSDDKPRPEPARIPLDIVAKPDKGTGK